MVRFGAVLLFSGFGVHGLGCRVSGFIDFPVCFILQTEATHYHASARTQTRNRKSSPAPATAGFKVWSSRGVNYFAQGSGQQGCWMGVMRTVAMMPVPSWRPRGRTKSVISRVLIRVTPFRVLITLLITHLLSPLGLQVCPSAI